MGCEKCDLAQAMQEQECYIRVGTANLLVFGCDEHLRQLIEMVRK